MDVTTEIQQLSIRETEDPARFEALLADLSARFINLPADQVDSGIEDAQRRICEFLGADRCVLWQRSEAVPDSLVPTHLYVAHEGLQPARQLSETTFPWVRQQMMAGRIVALSSLDDLPAEAALDRENALIIGIKSSFSIPLLVGGKPFIGVLSLNTLKAERAWPDLLIKQLGLVAQVFANAILRKRSEQALREGEEQLRLAADSAEAGLWSMDVLSGRFWLTDRARAPFGFTPEDVVTLARVMEAIHPEDREMVRKAVEDVAASDKDKHIEYRIVGADGTIRWMGSWGRMRYRADGSPERLMGLSMDVTERKRIEGDAHLLRKEIAHVSRVAAMGELTASLAHELNQPLTAIRSNAQAALRLMDAGKLDPEETRQIFKDIVADDERAGEVVRRVRSLLKKDEVVFHPLDLNRLITEGLVLFRMDAIIREVTITQDLSPELPPVRGDRVQLQQVLINLIINAFDAMKPVLGSRELVVRTERSASEGVVVTVQDSGPGVPGENMESIFAPFFTNKPGGMGMGLAICRSIIDSHGGRIWVENNPGCGAAFRFALPMAEVSAKGQVQ